MDSNETTPAAMSDSSANLGPLAQSTLDQFNAELAILDRPLEDDVEYFDPPAGHRWRRAGATVGAFVLLTAVAMFAVPRWSSPAVAREADQSPPLAVAAPESAAGLAPVAGPSDTPAAGGATAWQPAGTRHEPARLAHRTHHHHHHHHHAAGG